MRKISYGEGIERVLPLFSPQINKIEVVKSGSVRRSKLYYLRERSGKSARIAEKNIFNKTENNVDKEKKQEKQNINTEKPGDEVDKNNRANKISASEKKDIGEESTNEKVVESKPEPKKT